MPQLDVQSLIDSAVQQGQHHITLPDGVYDLVQPFVVPDCFAVRASCPISYGDFSSCELRGGADWPYMCRLAGNASYIEGVGFDALDRDSPPVIGIYLSGHAAEAHGCSVHWMRDFGYYVHATSGEGTNANGFALTGCRGARCGLAGFYANGAEVNAGRVERCDATGNFGYGFFDSPFLNITYDTCHASNNPLGNYAQGGTIEDPLDGGLSCYSKYDGCYSEAPAKSNGLYIHFPCRFVSAQNRIDGGNLARYAYGWQETPDMNGPFPPFPGSVGGTEAHELFSQEDVTVGVPGGAGLGLSVQLGAGQKVWQLLKKWVGSPSWFANTVALLRYDKTGWKVPYAVTDVAHAAGPGCPVQGMPEANSPFRYKLRKALTLQPGVSLVQFDSNLLLETSGGYEGFPYMEVILDPVPSGATVLLDQLFRVDANSVACWVENPTALPVDIVVWLKGGRAKGV